MMLNYLGKGVTYLFDLSFLAIIIYLIAISEYKKLVIVLIASAIAFFLATVIRKKINAPRPYELFEITPVVPKSTLGKSCPSRHSACAFIIAFSWKYAFLPIGIIMLVIAIFIAFSRLLMGVHFPLDVIFGGIISGIVALACFIFPIALHLV